MSENKNKYFIASPPISGGLKTLNNSETGEEIWTGLEDEVAKERAIGAEHGYKDGEKAGLATAKRLLTAMNNFLDAMGAEIILAPGTDYDAIEGELNDAMDEAENKTVILDQDSSAHEKIAWIKPPDEQVNNNL